MININNILNKSFNKKLFDFEELFFEERKNQPFHTNDQYLTINIEEVLSFYEQAKFSNFIFLPLDQNDADK